MRLCGSAANQRSPFVSTIPNASSNSDTASSGAYIRLLPFNSEKRVRRRSMRSVYCTEVRFDGRAKLAPPLGFTAADPCVADIYVAVSDSKFADSSVEGTGFELSVPRETGSGFETSSEFWGRSTVGAAVSSEQWSASAEPIERFRRLEEPTRRRMKAPTLSAGHRGTESSNPFPSSGEMLWGGRRGWQFRRLHQSMEWHDAPAERFEQVPRCPGPR